LQLQERQPATEESERERDQTEAAVDEVAECVAIAGVSEVVGAGRELLEALQGDAGELPAELGVLC